MEFIVFLLEKFWEESFESDTDVRAFLTFGLKREWKVTRKSTLFGFLGG